MEKIYDVVRSNGIAARTIPVAVKTTYIRTKYTEDIITQTAIPVTVDSTYIHKNLR